MHLRKKWSFLLILILAITVGVFLLLSVYYLLDPNLYRNAIQESLTSVLDREVTIGEAKISLWGGVGIAFKNFRVKDRSLKFDLLNSKRLLLKVKLLPLLKGEVKWKRIFLEQPIIRLARDKDRRFNIYNGPLTREGLQISEQKTIRTLSTLFGGSLTIRNGLISFIDENFDNTPPLLMEIRSFNLQLSEISYREPFSFRLYGEIGHPKKEGLFSVAGTIQNIPEDLDFSKGQIETDVEIKGIDIFHFWPFLKTLLPMKTISGTLDLKARYQGDFRGAFKTSARIKFKEVLFDYPKVFSYVMTPKWVNIDLDVNYDLKDIRVPRVFVEMPDIWVKAKGRIYAIGTKEMGMEAEAQSGPFDLSDGRKFIPYRIITPKVSDLLFRTEGSGPVQIVSVKLSGKMPEIAHCDQPVNAHVLSVEMKMDKARLKLPWSLPLLEDLKGRLLFKQGDLNLRDVGGRFLHSTVGRANGTFYRLLTVPTLQINGEGTFDLTDLSSLTKTEGFPSEFRQALSPIRIISGEAQYFLSAKGVLKPPLHFQHQGTYHLSKVRFNHPQIPFPLLISEGRVDLSNKGLQWSDTTLEFGHSSLLVNGSLSQGMKMEAFEIVAKGRVDLKNLFALSQSPFVPEEVRLKSKEIEGLSGTGQISFKGKRVQGTPPFSFEGEFIPKEASLLQKGNPVALIFREGILSFSNLGVGFSKAKFLFGKSSLILDGFVKEENINLSTSGSIDLKPLYSLLQSPLFSYRIDGIQELSGEAEIRLKWLGKVEQWFTALREGEIRLRGIFLKHQKLYVPLSDMEGSFRLLPEEIQFEGVKGRLGNSPLTLSGTVSRTLPSIAQSSKSGPGGILAESGRRLTFQLFSSQLDFDPLFPKREDTAPTSFEKLKEWLSNFIFDGKVEVEQGTYRSLHYQGLKAEMKTIDGKLFIRPFQFRGDGGDLWGEGWVEPVEKGVRFGIKPRLSNMEAKAFLRTLFQKGEEDKIVVTGRVHIDKVELQGEGENLQKVKESLNGGLRLELENGVIEKGNILAKIFSLLNVSQLFKGRLPDLRTKGLPYHCITATIQVKDGVASTEDLLVDSDAMRITLLGKVDLGKNLIDAKIGVHPLVTIDTILSNVPIVGYILTGRDKAFVSYIYEVKGNLDDPKIEALPIESIGEGFWGIIKRLLETPLRPFQKTP